MDNKNEMIEANQSLDTLISLLSASLSYKLELYCLCNVLIPHPDLADSIS